MKAQRKLIAALIAINALAAVTIPAVVAKAETDYSNINNLVNQAITEKNLYNYNLAYEKIMQLTNGYEKDVLLSKLSGIADTIWTKDIKELVQLIEIMAKEKSGRAYDALEAKIKKSDIKEIDKQYLYNELYGWGKDSVWTSDYKKAISAVIKVWNDKTENSSIEAEKAISELKVVMNKDYITGLLGEAKAAVGLIPLTLDSKYFDSVSNAAYVGDGKSINLDLSKDTIERTVTLKGNYKNIIINAPLATVILEDVNVNEITLGDVASHSLYIKGLTKVQNLVINDKSDNAHVVLQEKATISATEVKSGAKIEANTDSSVANPFGKLVINTEVKKAIELVGDLKTSLVQIQRPAELKVAAIVEKIEIGKDAKDTVVTIDKEGKVQELSAEAAAKVEGTGTLGKVTGNASSEVVKNVAQAPVVTAPIPGAGGGSGTTNPTYTINDIVKSVVSSFNGANVNARLSGSKIELSKKGDGEIGAVTINTPVPVGVSIVYSGIVLKQYDSVKSKTSSIETDFDSLKSVADNLGDIMIIVNLNDKDYEYTVRFE